MSIVSSQTIKFNIVPQQERYYNDGWGVYEFYTYDEIPGAKEVTFDPTILFSDDFKGNKKVYSSILAGPVQQLVLGQEYEVEATPTFNAKFNSHQFKPKVVIAKKPSSEKEQAKFLMSIVNPTQASVLLGVYPNIVNDILEGKDGNVDLSKTKGIKEATYKKIKEKVLENYVISDILSLLQPLGVSFNMIQKLLSDEPNPSLLKAKLLENPYIMTCVRGLGFKKVDGLAMKLNPDMLESDKRAYAFIIWYLNSVADGDGNTWITENQLREAAALNIPECMDTFEDVVKHEKETQILLHFDDFKVGLQKYFNIEKNVLECLKEINSYTKKYEFDVKSAISDAEKELGFSFTVEQREVVVRALEYPVVLIGGKAGVGKSTILNAIVKAYRKYKISCCALSAKAAQRVLEATGHEATTIHRLLGWNGKEFNHCHDNPLLSDVVILDEASMVNCSLFYDLVSAIKPGGRIIICGDNRQLPPIGAGNVFNDLLYKGNLFCVNRLTKVMRQAEMSGILSDANKIREGKSPLDKPELKVTTGELQDMTYMFRDSNEALKNIAIKSYLSAVEEKGLDNVVLIVPRKANCENCTEALNNEIQKQLFEDIETRKQIKYGDKVYCVGSKVIHRENNYEKNVFNGEIGYVTDVTYRKSSDDDDKPQACLLVEYTMNGHTKEILYNKSELKQIDLAYAMTVHLAQGSGYNTVIVIVDTSHYILLDNCLLYTALTRAKKRCLLLAQPKAYARCISQNKSTSRQTWMEYIN